MKKAKFLRLLAFPFVSRVSCLVFRVSSVYAGCWDDAIKEDDVVTLKGLECIFSRILNIVVQLAGLAVFIMLLIGGWQFLTSGGEKQAVAKARGTLTHAILGLTLLIASWFIMKFISTFTKVDVTNFVVVP